MGLRNSLLGAALAALLLSAPPAEAAKVLTVGDSISQGYGAALSSWMGGSQWRASNAGVVSSGLAQSGTLDWRGRLGPLVAQERPDAVLVSIGSNDGHDIAAGGALLKFGTPAWDAEYGRRTCAFAMDAASGGAAVVWMGPPPPWRGDGNARMARIAAIQRRCAEAVGARWVGLPDWLLDPSTALARDVRAPDGLHMTPKGYRLAAEWGLRAGLSGR